jgi:hypothetical protein
MKKLSLILALSIMTLSVTAQGPKANSSDVSSPDAIIKAVYDVISGDAGKPRDWDRFRSLFHPDARLIPTGFNKQTETYAATAVSPDGYVERTGPVFEKQGFHEREIARVAEQYGNIYHAFSSYEAFRSMDDKEPFMRGINSFQLLNDGKRWWILTIYWQAETPENPVPSKYLNKNK